MKRWGLTLGIVLFALVLSLCGESVVRAESAWETIEWGRMNDVQKFKWAVDLYKMDRADEAGPALQRVVESNPPARAVAEMRDSLDPVTRTAMLADAKTSAATKAWVDLYLASIEKLRVDEDYANEWAGKLASADGATADQATRRLEQIQEFGAAAVCRMMAQSQDAPQRVAGRGFLLRLGRSSVLPAVECLGAPDDALKLVILDVLGGLKDVRAQAAIVRLAKDAATTEAVRKAANDTLARIQHQPRPALGLSNMPPVNYWWLADACLHDKPFTLSEMEGAELPIWSYDAAKVLKFRLVPRKLYNEELSEDACYDGLALDKNDTSLRAMLIATYFAEKLELLGEDAGDVNKSLDLAILVGGRLALEQCMDKALLDSDLGIAIQAADAIGAVGAGKGFTQAANMKTVNPLLAGLVNEDRAVRFVSACAVVQCQPRVEGGGFDNYREVLPSLAWGLAYELPARTVLIIHPDTGVVNHYKAIVKAQGDDVLEATDFGAGAQLAGQLPRPDAVFIAAQFAGEIEGLRGIIGSNRVPFVVIGAEDAKDTPEGAAGLFPGKASEETVKLVLARVLDVPEKKLVKDLVPRISARAAEAFAAIVPAASILPVKTVVPALEAALASRDDSVRIPVLEALGRYGAGEASLPVLGVAAEKANAKPVRLAALEALGKILEAQESVPPDVFVGLVPISGEADPQVSLAAARAIACAKFDPAQFTDLMVLKRVQEIKAGKAE